MMIRKNPALLHELKRSVIYEVNVRQYTTEGTFKAFSEHLPRLKAMGIDIIWLMPIHPIGKINRKGSLGSYYSISNHQDINPEFGDKEDFRTLVQAIHQLGMKVIIDWVANHAAWDHVWTIHHPEYFVHESNGQFHSPYDWTDVIQLDHHCQQAHEAMRESMCYWVREFDIDGFRADLAHLTPLHYWIQARGQCETIKSDLIWLAETEDATFYEAFDIVYAWKWMHETEHFCKQDWSVKHLIQVLKEQNNPYPQEALQLYFTTNHDENSWNGTEYEKYGTFAEALAVFSFFYPSSLPLIYSGQEIPNQRRLAFFEKDALSWEQQPALHNFYHQLTTYRKQNPVDAQIDFIDAGDKVLVFRLHADNQLLYVMLNMNAHETRVKFNDELANGEMMELFKGVTFHFQGVIESTLPAAGYSVIIKA